MNEIGKRAREAAIDHGMWLAPDDDETNYQAFVAGYLRGYSDRGVEATAARDEYEKEIATLRARVAELEGRDRSAVALLRKWKYGWTFGRYVPVEESQAFINAAPIPLPGAEG